MNPALAFTNRDASSSSNLIKCVAYLEVLCFCLSDVKSDVCTKVYNTMKLLRSSSAMHFHTEFNNIKDRISVSSHILLIALKCNQTLSFSLNVIIYIVDASLNAATP